MNSERAAIDRQLEAIFASADFVSAPKMRQLLRYLVDATLSGDAERLKGYAIGVDVFERGAQFDPGADPIVRVQAGRLRKLLDTYYRTTGQSDPIRIGIPKGGYAVALDFGGDGATAEAVPPPGARGGYKGLEKSAARRRHLGHLPLLLFIGLSTFVGLFLVIQSFDNSTTSTVGDGDLAPAANAITLAVLPFVDMSKDGANAHFGDGLADALTTALARVKALAVVSRTSAFQYRQAADLRRVGHELGVRYIIEGGLQHEGDLMRLNVQLIDALSGARLWAHQYDRITDGLDAQSELVTTLAAELRPQLVNAAKRAVEARPGQPATAWQLYIQSTWMPGASARNSLAWEKQRVELAKRALERDPNLGQADSVLADKLAYLANVDPPSDTEAARAEAALHARRAMELAPDDADAVFNVSIHYWHAGRIAESLAAKRRTLELDPNHVLARFLFKAVPYTCAAAPQAAIDELAAFDANLSPDNPVRWVTLTWISLLNLFNGDFPLALEAARRSDQIFRTPYTVFYLAGILVQLGKKDEAVSEIDRQRVTWPTLDPRHFADVAVPRLCGQAARADFVRRIFDDLADAVEAARQGP